MTVAIDKTMIGQAVRFGVAGGFVTFLSTFTYWLAVYAGGATPLAATLLGYLLAVLVGFRLHRAWSFRGMSGHRSETAENLRFFTVSLITLALNAAWVWALTGLLAGPEWWPIIPMVSLTPLCAFILNRCWVFRPA